MLLIKKWADAHKLTMKEKVSKYILGANSIMVWIMGMTKISLVLVPTLEMDMANVSRWLGDF